MNPSLGIDPGKTEGGMSLLVPDKSRGFGVRLAESVEWYQHTAKKRPVWSVRALNGETAGPFPRLDLALSEAAMIMVVALLREGYAPADCLLTCEQMLLGKRGKGETTNTRTFNALCTSAGEAIASCTSAGISGDMLIMRPTVKDWRHKVLNCEDVGAAKGYAIAAVHDERGGRMRKVRLDIIPSGNPEGMKVMRSTHTSEACCIAMYGHQVANMSQPWPCPEWLARAKKD